MIHSMTGFGEARCEEDGRTYHLEVRSVNNRYLKTTLHLPDEFATLDAELERLLRQHVQRGSVTVRLHVREQNPDPSLHIDLRVLQAYLAKLEAAGAHSDRVRIDLVTLLTLPGVAQPQEITDEQRAARGKLLTRLANEALGNLVTMRRTEGAALAQDLQNHCDAVRRSLDVIRGRVGHVVEEYRDRLRARVLDLINDSNVQLAEDDLLREVSIYAERSDISEELSRLDGHLEQFAAQMAGGEAAGRKLEFIAQEMLREANTIGSKTGDAAIAREIIEVKAAIDRVKEQVQNAE